MCAPSDQALRIFSCFIHLNERMLHNIVTVLADYDNYPAERDHLRLGPVVDVADGKPARWLDVSEERLARREFGPLRSFNVRAEGVWLQRCAL